MQHNGPVLGAPRSRPPQRTDAADSAVGTWAAATAGLMLAIGGLTGCGQTALAQPDGVTLSTTGSVDDSEPVAEEAAGGIVREGTRSTMTVEAITAAIDPYNERTNLAVMSWGDVDGDGDDDAVVLTTWCGASCGNQLDLVFDSGGVPVTYSEPWDNAFEPWFIPAGAAQSFDVGAVIDGSTIALTGQNLCGATSSDDNPDWPCDPDEVRQATYRFVDGVLTPVSVKVIARRVDADQSPTA